MVKSVEINDYSYIERKKEEDCYLERYYKFIDENGLEVIRVDCGIASISFFRIYVSLSSKSIQFGT